MPCNCSRTNCLKQYCVCFQAGTPCTKQCNCCNCENKDGHKKRIDKMESMRKESKTVFTPQHLTRVGCACPRSGCDKKYCVCFKMGVECTALCRCVGCKNCKPGIVPIEVNSEVPIKDSDRDLLFAL